MTTMNDSLPEFHPGRTFTYADLRRMPNGELLTMSCRGRLKTIQLVGNLPSDVSWKAQDIRTFRIFRLERYRNAQYRLVVDVRWKDMLDLAVRALSVTRDDSSRLACDCRESAVAAIQYLGHSLDQLRSESRETTYRELVNQLLVQCTDFYAAFDAQQLFALAAELQASRLTTGKQTAEVQLFHYRVRRFLWMLVEDARRQRLAAMASQSKLRPAGIR